jgi:Fe-S-cluster containining protein
MNEDFEKLKERILDEADRLGPDDAFSFSCHPGISCFNECCGDVNIALTPYDVLRLKRRLGLSSNDFLKRYTIKPFTQGQKLPVVLLKMDESRQGKPCPLVTEKGCSVYDDRPWPCRMYPIGSASARTEQDAGAPEFFFVLQEEGCKGFGEQKQWTIQNWMDDQGVPEYNRWGEEFKEISLHPRLAKMELNPQQMEMYHTACYDLDRFRSFVFDSSFLDKYELEPEVVEAIRTEDDELLRFAFRWLRTCLFGEQTVKPKTEVVEKYKERLEQQGMKPK